jgi:hypothetical protein
MKFDVVGEVDVYPVGWLSAIQQRRLRREWWLMRRWIKQRNWRAIKNSFNGYLAEPREWPEGLRRCGSGWTKARAKRDLARRIRLSEGEDHG